MSDIAQPHVPVRLRVRSSRLIVMVGAFLAIAGAIVAVATYPAQQVWLRHRNEHGRLERR